MARRPEKNDGAFRTIREVADWLGVPTHVLRFWESKFDQVAPVKGAGGRRYYRPEDMRLLGGIKVLLHDQGQTIRGVVQKIDDEGVEPICALAPELEAPERAGRTRRVIRKDDAPTPVPDVAPPAPEVVAPEVEAPTPELVEDAVVFEPNDQPVDAPAEPELVAPAETAPVAVPEPEPLAAETPVVEPEPALVAKAEPLDPSTPMPPSAAALALVRGATGCNDPRRMRRVTRRLRGLAAEIADDLAG